MLRISENIYSNYMQKKITLKSVEKLIEMFIQIYSGRKKEYAVLKKYILFAEINLHQFLKWN